MSYALSQVQLAPGPGLTRIRVQIGVQVRFRVQKQLWTRIKLWPGILLFFFQCDLQIYLLFELDFQRISTSLRSECQNVYFNQKKPEKNTNIVIIIPVRICGLPNQSGSGLGSKSEPVVSSALVTSESSTLVTCLIQNILKSVVWLRRNGLQNVTMNGQTDRASRRFVPTYFLRILYHISLREKKHQLEDTLE